MARSVSQLSQLLAVESQWLGVGRSVFQWGRSDSQCVAVSFSGVAVARSVSQWLAVSRSGVAVACSGVEVCQNVQIYILKPHMCYLVESSSRCITHLYTTSEPKNRSPYFYHTL